MRVPLQQQSVWGRALRRWFDPRGRNVSLIGFALFRLSGLGLTLYLVLHFIALTSLVRGEAAWLAFIEMAHSPLFLFFDIIVFAGILVHGLNGLRVAAVGLGFGTRNHKSLFWIAMIVAALALVCSAWLVIRIG